MSEPIIYVDHSRVREGKLAELKTAMDELVEFVQANEPQLIAYNVYFSEDLASMSIVHIHADSESLEYHMKVGGPLFAKFAEYIKLLSIDLYGRPGDGLVQQLRQKAQMLGEGEVHVHELHAGFARFGTR